MMAVVQWTRREKLRERKEKLDRFGKMKRLGELIEGQNGHCKLQLKIVLILQKNPNKMLVCNQVSLGDFSRKFLLRYFKTGPKKNDSNH